MEQEKKRKPQRRGRSVVGNICFGLWTLFLIGVLSLAMLAGIFFMYVKTTVAPSLDFNPDDYTMKLTSFLYYQDRSTGEWVEYQSYHGTENRIPVKFSEMPDAIWQAAVAIEDHRFFEHHGVDWKRTLGAALKVATGDASYGGSTITQQMLKNFTGDNHPYINRKIREIVRALEFEKTTSKQQILEMYLNRVTFGQGCYGVQAAAQYYFGKDVSDLSVAECASIIAITNNPSMYGPMSTVVFTNPETGAKKTARELNKQRQELIIDRMASDKVGLNYLTKAEAEAAKAEVLHFADGTTSAEDLVEKDTNPIPVNSWFVDKVIDDVAKDLAAQQHIDKESAYVLLMNGGYKIYTTLDPKIQEIAESVYEDRSNLDITSKKGKPIQSGITIVEPATGNVVAMVGKIGEKTGNRVTNFAMLPHQVGSSIKPLTVYAPAIDAGVVTPGTTFDNYPVRLLNNKPWPKNSPNKYTGFTTVQEGLKNSINTIAVQTVEKLGIPESFAFATENLHLNLIPEDMNLSSLGLGGLTRGLNTEEMAAAFAAFANDGVYNKPRTYVKVTKPQADGSEKVILEKDSEPQVAMQETTAYLMNKMLKSVVNGGTGTSAKFNGMTIAGKTGTTSNNHDRYFVGYTPYYCAAVWTGYEESEKIVYKGNPSITMWKKVMQKIHEGLENRDFHKPSSGLTTIKVCADSGLLPTDACYADPRGSRVIDVEVAKGTEPTESCNLHIFKDYCIAGDVPATEFCPPEQVQPRAFLDYVRTDYGESIKAADDAYLLCNQDQKLAPTEANPNGGCPIHNAGTVPVEPEFPPEEIDPDIPYYPPEPEGELPGPGGETVPEEAVPPTDPQPEPIDPGTGEEFWGEFWGTPQ